MKKLEDFGIRGVVLNWFKSYLKNRRQRVKIGNYVSGELTNEFGVPQGSILAPTLFTMYIDDVLRLNILNADLICYADDTVVLYNGKNWSDTFRAAEIGMRHINNWLNANLLTLNLKKTHFIGFHINYATCPKQNSIPIHESSCILSATNLQNCITCQCSSINRVRSTKYLGVTIDKNLNFKEHISKTSKTVRKLIYMMKLLRKGASIEVRRLIYIALCQPIINYCIGVWGGTGKHSMMELERAQRAILKVMLGKPRRFRPSLPRSFSSACSSVVHSKGSYKNS